MSKEKLGSEISLKELIIIGVDWFRYLLTKWKIILLAGIIGGSLGFLFAFKSKPVYTASLSFALEDDKSNGGLSGALGFASQFGFDFGQSGGGIFAGTNLIELFKSRAMVEQALLAPVTLNKEVVSFAEMYIYNHQWREKWKNKDGLNGVKFLPNADRGNFSRVQDSILGSIYSGVSNAELKVLQKDKKIDIITIEIKSEDEIFAKYFTEALAKQVSDFYIATKSKKAQMNMDILERQTDSIRHELNSAITGVAVANDNTFGLNPALNVRRTPSAKRQVDVQANTAILIELVKQTELAKVTLRKETPLIQVIDRPIFPLKKEKLGKSKGLILGGFLTGFLIVFYLSARRLFKQFFKNG